MTKNNKKWYAYERQSHYSLDKPSITIAANCIFFNSALVKKMGLKNFKSIRIEFDDPYPSKATAIRLVGKMMALICLILQLDIRNLSVH